MSKILSFFLMASIVMSCASAYHPITPASVNYSNTNTKDDVSFSYHYDVLREHANKKYAKREPLKAIKVVAITITNSSSKPLTIGANAKLFSGDNEVVLIDPLTVHKELKQGVPVYLLYLLMTPITLNVGTTDSHGARSTNHTPIGYVLGPGLTLLNMLIAGGANQKFLKELTDYSLINKTIEPGQKVYGLIGIRDVGYNPLILKRID